MLTGSSGDVDQRTIVRGTGPDGGTNDSTDFAAALSPVLHEPSGLDGHVVRCLPDDELPNSVYGWACQQLS